MRDDRVLAIRSPAFRVRLLRLLNGPIDEPAGSRAREKRLLHRAIILHYEIGREQRLGVAAALGLSLRQFHREHRAAIEWAASCLDVTARAEPFKLSDIFELERLTLERLAPALAFAEAQRRFEILLSSQVEPLPRALTHVAFYEFLSARDERDAVRAQQSAVGTAIAAIDDDRARGNAQARRRLVDAQIAWRDGSYATALAAAGDAATFVSHCADGGLDEHAITLCNALQLQAQLRWETGSAHAALAALDRAECVIRHHNLRTLPCAVTNSVGRSDLLMRDAAMVPNAIRVAAEAFDQAALYGDAEDASTALLIGAMAYCGQRKLEAAVEYVDYALHFVHDLAPVGRTRVLAHAAEVYIICGLFSRASLALEQARSLVPAGSTADAQRQLRLALLFEVRGAPAEALPIVDDAIASLERKEAKRFIGAGLKIRARVRLKLGDRTGAVADLERAVNHLYGESYAWTYADALHQLGRATKNRLFLQEAAAMNRAIGAG